MVSPSPSSSLPPSSLAWRGPPRPGRGAQPRPRCGRPRRGPPLPGAVRATPAPVPVRARPSPLPTHPRPGDPGALGTALAPAHARRSVLAAMARGSRLGRREAPTPACPLAAMAPGMARAMPRRGPPYARCPRRGSSCPHGATVAPGTMRAVLAQRGRGALAKNSYAYRLFTKNW
jgi:hypothetical protein